MGTESREEILSEFQKCTGLENFDECIYILDQNDWNLQRAVHEILEKLGSTADNRESTVPCPTTDQIDENLSIEPKPNNKRQSYPDELEQFNENREIKITSGTQRFASNDNHRMNVIRELHFDIDFAGEHFQLISFDNQTILDLKQQIFDKTQLVIDEQHFLNWTDKIYSNYSILRDLHLPKENLIQLVPMADRSMNQLTTAPISSQHSDFRLIVQVQKQSGETQTFSYNFTAFTTVEEIKLLFAKISNIPIVEQIWTGLADSDDHDQLGQTKISFPARLTLRSTNLIGDQFRDNQENEKNEKMDIDQEINTFNAENTDLTVTSTVNPVAFSNDTEILLNQHPLMPDDCCDDIAALEHFSQVFHSRYNSTGPILYPGSFDQAIQDSLYTSINDRRPLAVYIHNDRSLSANDFCSQVLAADSIIEYLSNNYIFWAWDITHDSNRQRLNEVIRRCSATQCFDRIEAMDNNCFPLLLLLTRNRGTLDVLDMIEGKSTPMEVISSLIQAHESFQEQCHRDAEEELLRGRREELKRQQEDEYSQSIAADLEKQRLKQDDERKQREEKDAHERLKQERLKKQHEYLLSLPPEPTETDQNTTTIKIRLPDGGGVLMRRFFITDHIQILFDYLTSQGQMFGEYKLLTTYPKRDITTIDGTGTFEQLKLYPQEQLFLESI